MYLLFEIHGSPHRAEGICKNDAYEEPRAKSLNGLARASTSRCRPRSTRNPAQVNDLNLSSLMMVRATPPLSSPKAASLQRNSAGPVRTNKSYLCVCTNQAAGSLRARSSFSGDWHRNMLRVITDVITRFENLFIGLGCCLHVALVMQVRTHIGAGQSALNQSDFIPPVSPSSAPTSQQVLRHVFRQS